MADSTDTTDLTKAVATAGIDLVERALDIPVVDINQRDNEGRTLLFVAAQNGARDAVSYLIAKDADINLADKWGRTPLLLAIASGHNEVAGGLLAQENIDIHARDIDGQSALSIVQYKTQKNIMTSLLQRPDINREICLNWERKGTSFTLLIEAIVAGDSGMVDLLLQIESVNPNKVTSKRLTAIGCAVQQGKTEAIELLYGRADRRGDVDFNAPFTLDYSIATEFYDTYAVGTHASPLLHAASRREWMVVKLLLTRKTVCETLDEDRRYMDKVLSIVARYGETEIVRLILDSMTRDFSVNPQVAGDPKAPIVMALRKGHIDIVQLLLDRSKHRILVHTVAAVHKAKHFESLLNILLQRPDFNINSYENVYRDTLLVAATMDWQTEVVEIILRQPNVEINIRNRDGQTALEIAKNLKNYKVVKMLQDYASRTHCNVALAS